MYKSELKEMTYDTTEQSILYLEVNDDDTAIVIIDRGGWPCSYIKMPDEIYQNYVESICWDGDYDDIDVFVHGGVTFGSCDGLYVNGKRDDRIPDGYYLGWDYNHFGDYYYSPYSTMCSSHPELYNKYTTEQLVDEAHEALEELRENNFRIYQLND